MSRDGFKQLDTAEQIVFNYLKTVPISRDSTTHLYYLVLKEYYQATSKQGRKCNEADFLSDLYDLLHYAPCDETVQRSRRKVQNRYKLFKPSKAVQKIRDERQDDYIDYSRAD